MAETLTARQLAERIARAVLKTVDQDEEFLAPHDGYFDPEWSKEWGSTPDLAADVLIVLRDSGHWFCRVTETLDETVTEQLPLGLEGEHV